MEKCKKVGSMIKKVIAHVKRNSCNYIILGILICLVYHISKVVRDTGMNKDGEPYYKDFDDPETITE